MALGDVGATCLPAHSREEREDELQSGRAAACEADERGIMQQPNNTRELSAPDVTLSEALL